MTNATTVIENGLVVAFDGKEHRIIDGGFVAFCGDRITEVGTRFEGSADRRIQARGKLVIPGLISVHAHAGIDPGGRMIVDGGRRELWRSGFFNYEPVNGRNGLSFGRNGDPIAAMRYGLAALLKNGSTTAVELGGGDGGADEAMVELAGEAGIRLYYGPTFYSGLYRFDESGRFALQPDDRQGNEGLDHAIDFIERHDGGNDGRLRGILVPSSFLRTPRDLFGRVKRAAADLGVGITFHITESLWEFHETVNRTGRTPIGIVADWDVLGPEVLLGHTIYVSGHSQTAWPYKGDLEVIAASGASVAHAPVTFARRGVALESFQRYLDHGINVGIGTDTYPLDIMEEMRTVALAGKLTDTNFEAARARDVFNAATIGGAKALGRPDLGRLAAGAKADIVLVDVDNLRMSPFTDPIRALVYCGSGENVETVIVDGRTVVENHRIVAWNEQDVLEAARASAKSVWESFSEYDFEGLTVEQRYPPSFKPWDGDQPSVEPATTAEDVA